MHIGSQIVKGGKKSLARTPPAKRRGSVLLHEPSREEGLSPVCPQVAPRVVASMVLHQNKAS